MQFELIYNLMLFFFFRICSIFFFKHQIWILFFLFYFILFYFILLFLKTKKFDIQYCNQFV